MNPEIIARATCERCHTVAQFEREGSNEPFYTSAFDASMRKGGWGYIDGKLFCRACADTFQAWLAEFGGEDGD